jgi:hypothetical protein
MLGQAILSALQRLDAAATTVLAHCAQERDVGGAKGMNNPLQHFVKPRT